MENESETAQATVKFLCTTYDCRQLHYEAPMEPEGEPKDPGCPRCGEKGIRL